jgi:hypothetical protein
MNSGLVGLYGLYLLFVGYHGNTKTLFTMFGQDAKSFAPVVIAVVILAGLNKSDTLKPFIGPFIGLALLTFALTQYGNIAGNVDNLFGTHFSQGKV